MNKMTEEFSFIIARIWDDTKPVAFPNLGIYTYFETVHTGTQEFARGLLEEIQLRNHGSKYYIFPVTLGLALNE